MSDIQPQEIKEIKEQEKDNSDLFVKANVKILKNEGLLGVLGAERFHTLMAVALYLPNPKPTVRTLSRVLNISESSVSRRIGQLNGFKFKGDYIFSVVKKRRKNGRFLSNSYDIRKRSGLSMY
jgi:hypothetical protein